MANTLLTPSMITREALRVLNNNLVFIKGTKRQYSSEFAQAGAKIGSTVNLRKPNRYFVRTGQTMQVQQTNETYVPLTLNRQWGVDVSFSSLDLSLSLDDFSKRVLTPAMARLASQLDIDGLSMAITGAYADGTVTAGAGPVYNIVGTPGTTPGTSGGSATLLQQYNAPICFLNAGMMMDNFAAPRDENRRIVMNPAAHAQSVSGLSGLINDSAAIAEQYRKGVLGNALGFEFAMDQNIYNFNSNTGVSLGTITLTPGSANASATGVTSGGIFPAGMAFTIPGVYSVNPENQQSTGQLQQFVVTATTTATTTTIASLPISPTPVLAGTGVAAGTVTYATTSLLVGTATVVTGTTASTSYPQNLAYHQDAFTLATADLELPRGVDFAARETYDGISMRIVRAFDITNDLFPCRIDVLGGWATLRPELACRITG